MLVLRGRRPQAFRPGWRVRRVVGASGGGRGFRIQYHREHAGDAPFDPPSAGMTLNDRDVTPIGRWFPWPAVSTASLTRPTSYL